MKAGVGIKKTADMSGKTAFVSAKSQLRQLNIRAVKGLGQHFLIDHSVLRTIVSAADLSPGDIVVEVGPGLGILTEELVKKARSVIAIEVDPRLAANLESRYAKRENLHVVNDDILKLDIELLVRNIALRPEISPGYKVIANLPYYIAAPILRHFLESSLKPKSMVTMVQKEVAQSIVAGPGAMSLLGISVQLYGKPGIVDYVLAQSFYPEPKVDSAIVKINVYSKPAVDIRDIDGFFKVIKAGFSAPRKQLRNSLSMGLKAESQVVEEILKQAGIEPQRRPQTLSLEEWAKVFKVYSVRGQL